MKITVSELRLIVDLLLLHLNNTNQKTFVLEEDYYWDVSMADRFSLDNSPKDLNVGQISDDLKRIRLLLSGDRDPVGYDLVRLSAILRTIGEKTIL